MFRAVRIVAVIGLAALSAACAQRPMNQSVLPTANSALPAHVALSAAPVPLVKVRFKEYKLPKAYSGPVHIAPGPSGTNVLWFTEHAANALGMISTKGKITEHPLFARAPVGNPDESALAFSHGPPMASRPIPTITIPPTGNAPYGITAGSDRNIWFTNENDGQNMIGKHTSSKTLQYYVDRDCCMQNIVAGPDKALWFPISNAYDFNTNAIGKVTTNGKVTIFDIGYNTVPANITVGPDKALWFTESYTDKIGRMTTAGKLTNQFPLPTSGSMPQDITTGPDGNLWFTEWYGNKIGKMTRKGKVTEYAVKTSGAGLAGIAVGPDKALWFTEVSANKIGRITTKGAVSEFTIPTAYSQPFFITLGPDKALWFTEYGASKIGRVQPI